MMLPKDIIIPTAGVIGIKNAYASHGDANDSPIFRKHLVINARFRKDRRMHGDRAYFCKENIEICKEKQIRPNFVPKENASRGLVLKRAIQEYDDNARKKYRGIIEGIFGGTQVDIGNITRYIKDRCRKTHLMLIALTHQIRTYFRALEIKALKFFYFFCDNPS